MQQFASQSENKIQAKICENFYSTYIVLSEVDKTERRLMLNEQLSHTACTMLLTSFYAGPGGFLWCTGGVLAAATLLEVLCQRNTLLRKSEHMLFLSMDRFGILF